MISSRTFSILAFLFFTTFSYAVPTPVPNDSVGSQLESRILSLVKSKFPNARIGLSVRITRSDSVLHQINADQWFTPASTMKVLTSAAAVDTMPLDWTPVTRISLDGIQQGKRFLGIIRVIGGGDPNLSARFWNDPLTVPLAMVDSIRSLGIDTIVGMLQADESWFQGPRRPAGWRPYFFNTWYGTEVSALSFNDNVYQFIVSPGDSASQPARFDFRPNVGYIRVINQATTVKGRKSQIAIQLDSAANVITIKGTIGVSSGPEQVVLPVRNPAGYFLAALQRAMKERKMVLVADSAMRPSLPLALYSFGAIPFQSILDEVNQRSQNLHAEMLLRNLGKLRVQDGSTQGGVHACKLFLEKMKISEGEFYQVDGCGLSPENKVKPAAVSLLLSKMTRHPRGVIFANSMAQPGVTGMSARRLAWLEMAHEVRMKTGYIGGVQGLAGYIGTSQGDSLAVALYLNGLPEPDPTARVVMDSIWTWIANAYNQEFRSVREARSLWHEADSIHDFQTRVEYFSSRLMGRPYFLGPTGEGYGATIDPKPRMDLSRFDCVTYLEHVLALAKAKNPDRIMDTLQALRYIGGEIRFEKRKHYFVEDWIGKSPEWVRLARMSGDSVIVREMDKKSFFAAKQMSWEGANPQTSIPHLPIEKAIELAKRWDGPDTIMGIAFMTTLPKLCVFHTGFLIAKKGQPLRFRHASQLKGQTTEQDLGEYLQSKKAKIPGVVFFDLLP